MKLVLLGALAFTAACVSQGEPTRAQSSAPESAIDRVVSVRDGRTGERLPFDAMLDRLARADAVFLGETHTDGTTHRVEAETYSGLLARRDGRVVLALEMFERDVQPALDAYLRGEIDEAEFIAGSRPWSNYRTAYRPLIEQAKAGAHPVVAANFPAPLRRRVGTDGLDALTPEERATTPAELLANTPEYWRRVDNAVRGHAGMMGPTPAVDDPRLTSVQSLWDNSMGEACALALERNPGSSVLHVNGGFHTEYWDGTARQLRLRAPKARIATVAIVPSANPFVEELFGAPVADFVVYVEERAQDVNDGEYAVFVPRKLEYRLHVPSSASDTSLVPLLVWLADDGESAADVFALWKARVGDQAAVLVVEPPYREIQDDLVPGGRWFWPDSFAEDMSALREGVARALEFVARHQPVDVARTCIAGEGTGATVAAVIGLLDERGSARVLAYEPRHFTKIADFPLPLAELRGDEPAPARALRVVPRADDEVWWENEIAQYREVGLSAQLARAPTDPWSTELSRENGVRTALGLAPRVVPEDAERAHVRVDSSRARSWARLAAQVRANETLVALLAPDAAEPSRSAEMPLTVRAADFTKPGTLPACPGAFGGTTIVVLPEGLAREEVDAWHALEESQAKGGRRRHVVADASGERSLANVLGELAAEKRTNVLIVPAVWCADGATMRALQTAARPFEDRMTLNWRPGLGGLEPTATGPR